jgi:hypothetical protein
MKKLGSLILAMAIAFLAVNVGASNTNLVVNGSFESPDVPSGFWRWSNNPAYLEGWDFAHTYPGEADYEPRIEIWDHYRGWLPYDGDQHIELDVFDPTTISQTVPTISGNCYELSYAWSPRPEIADNQLMVWLDGSEIGYHVASGVENTQTDWTSESFIYIAFGPTVLKFAEVGPDDQLGMLLDNVKLTASADECPEITTILIDIKPGSDPNCLNSNSHGVIPVALLGSNEFNASTIDPSSIVLEGAGVRIKGKSGNAGSLEDVNGDGFLDLVVQIVDEGTIVSGTTDATLAGYTFGGDILIGADTICVQPAG